MRLAADGRAGEGFVVEDGPEAVVGAVGLAGRREQPRVDELHLGAALVVFVVAAHLADERERLVLPPGVEPEHERAADAGGVAGLVGARPRVSEGVGLDGGVPVGGLLLYLAEQEVAPGGEVAVVHAVGAGAERLGGHVPAAGAGVELAEREGQAGLPAAVGVGPRRGVLEHLDALVVALGGGERAAEPEARLGGQARRPARLGGGGRLAELLLGPDDVVLVEVGLADEQQGVVGPLGARAVA